MYRSACDSTSGVGVAILGDSKNVDPVYEAAIKDIVEWNRSAGEAQRPSICVLFVHRGAPLPSPLWRKRFSEVNQCLAHRPHYMFFVTESAPMRGAFTAVVWLSGTRDGHTFKALASAAEVDAWLEGNLGPEFAVVQRLENGIRRETLPENRARA